MNSENHQPINAVGPYKDRFLPLREHSELPQLLLYFSSVFFSERQYWGPSSHENFLADYVLYSITADAIRTILGVYT
jgi:hypothetical protein